MYTRLSRQVLGHSGERARLSFNENAAGIFEDSSLKSRRTLPPTVSLDWQSSRFANRESSDDGFNEELSLVVSRDCTVLLKIDISLSNKLVACIDSQKLQSGNSYLIDLTPVNSINFEWLGASFASPLQVDGINFHVGVRNIGFPKSSHFFSVL